MHADRLVEYIQVFPYLTTCAWYCMQVENP